MLGRDPEYISFCVNFGVNIGNSAPVIRLLPLWLRGWPNICYFWTSLTNHDDGRRQARRSALYCIEEEHGPPQAASGTPSSTDATVRKDYPGKPVGPLTVYTPSIVGEPAGVLCLISTNDGIQSFTQALYHLASPPEYIQPLCEEIEVYYHDLWRGFGNGGWGLRVRLSLGLLRIIFRMTYYSRKRVQTTGNVPGWNL